MHKPDVEFVIERDDDGKIIGCSYKINKRDKDGSNVLEFIRLACEALASDAMVPTTQTSVEVSTTNNNYKTRK